MRVEMKDWTKFGETANASFYQIDECTLAVVPVDGCTDDEQTAAASIDLQRTYLVSKGFRAGSVIFMDGIAQQTSGARTVYRELPDPECQVCFALVGGSVFGRLVGSVFLGLSKPRVPTQLFATPDQAIAWCLEQVYKG